MNREKLFAVLKAYSEAVAVAAPSLHPNMPNRVRAWALETEAQLAQELEDYLQEASAESCPVRLFFKFGTELIYGGCNLQFARDAGLPSAEAIVGKDDYDPQIAWVSQAGKYRRDDRDVMDSGQPKLGIIERQSSASGVIWLDTSKVPIQVDDHTIGVFGTYEVIDVPGGRPIKTWTRGVPLEAMAIIQNNPPGRGN